MVQQFSCLNKPDTKKVPSTLQGDSGKIIPQFKQAYRKLPVKAGFQAYSLYLKPGGAYFIEPPTTGIVTSVPSRSTVSSVPGIG
jgi:hypothetical protein